MKRLLLVALAAGAMMIALAPGAAASGTVIPPRELKGPGLIASHTGSGALNVKLPGARRPLATSVGATSTPTFSVVPSPTLGPSSNQLSGVAALSASDVWAVGYKSTPTIAGPIPATLIEHFDGTSWSVVPSPNPTDAYVQNGSLFGVAATSSHDVWAVGQYVNRFGLQQGLIEHYDGSSWRIVSSPTVAGLGNELWGVAVVPGTGTVWAVGDYINGYTTYQTLVERWTGSRWAVVPSPDYGNSANMLVGVAAVSDSEVWAVGAWDTGTPTMFVMLRTLAERWDGSRWNIVSTPNQDTIYGADDNMLFGVSVVPGTHTVWAVGTATLDMPTGFNSAARLNQGLTEKFTGGSWTIVPSAHIGPANEGLGAVSAVSGTNVFAVGVYMNATGWDSTLVEHFDGVGWTILGSATVGTLENSLSGVAAVPGSAFAVGYYTVGNFTSPGPSRTLIERESGI